MSSLEFGYWLLVGNPRMELWGVYSGYYRNPLLHSLLTTRKFVATLHTIPDDQGHELAGQDVSSGGPRIICVFVGRTHWNISATLPKP